MKVDSSAMLSFIKKKLHNTNQLIYITTTNLLINMSQILKTGPRNVQSFLIMTIGNNGLVSKEDKKIKSNVLKKGFLKDFYVRAQSETLTETKTLFNILFL